MSSKSPVNLLPFMRITILGASQSGKTCFVNSFVNHNFQTRYLKTDQAVVYYKKVEVVDEDDGGFDDKGGGPKKKPYLVEIEDTPGSEAGPEGDDDVGDDDDKQGQPKIRKGSRVTLKRDKGEVMRLFKDPKYQGRLQYKPGMDAMLGKDFTVKTAPKKESADDTYGLESPDGSEGGVWNFPPGSLELKVSLELPIDRFLMLNRATEVQKPKDLMTAKKKKDYQRKLLEPLKAYERPIGPVDMDKTLTKNRMGFLICFDLSDENGQSLMEAMTVHGMLKKAIAKQTQFEPYVWLVGTKMDKTADYKAISKNTRSAEAWSNKEEIPFYPTSAKWYARVSDVFQEMINTMSSREILWTFERVDDDAGEGDDESQCAIH